MSCFILGNKELNQLVAWLVDSERVYEIFGFVKCPPYFFNGQTVGEKMRLLNEAAYFYRYGEVKHAPFVFVSRLPCSDVQAFKLLQCFTYQCSEGNILKRKLFKLLAAIKIALAYKIISELPEYEKAAWG
jgi:hypothetical protein